MHIDDETTDVLIGGYLSTDAAHEDYEAVLALRRAPLGRRRGEQGPRGQPLGRADRPHGRGGRRRARRASASSVGLFAPPLLAATAIGAAVGAVGGKALHKKIGSRHRGDGRRDDPDRWRRPDRGLSALGGREGRAGGDPGDAEGRRRGRGSPRARPSRARSPTPSRRWPKRLRTASALTERRTTAARQNCLMASRRSALPNLLAT